MQLLGYPDGQGGMPDAPKMHQGSSKGNASRSVAAPCPMGQSNEATGVEHVTPVMVDINGYFMQRIAMNNWISHPLSILRML